MNLKVCNGPAVTVPNGRLFQGSAVREKRKLGTSVQANRGFEEGTWMIIINMAMVSIQDNRIRGDERVN